MLFILQRIRYFNSTDSYPNKNLSRKKRYLILFSKALFFLLLTAITQIGGLVFLLTILISKRFKIKNLAISIFIFIGLYTFSTFVLVPKIAPLFGREKIVSNEFVKPHSIFYSWTNRNYVTASLQEVIQNAGKKISIKNPGIQLVYLDANFPFIDGFPLLPHRYHNDGKKIDITFIYKDGTKLTNAKPSFSGYGIFESPTNGEVNQINECLETGYKQYDFTKYVTLGSINPQLQFSKTANRNFINTFLSEKDVHTIFIEPHLKSRLDLENDKFVYHGCGTVRHDDHIHVEVN